MRWQELFEDLAAQQAALELRERQVEIAEHTRAERGQVSLLDRLGAHQGHPLRLRVRGVGWVAGRLSGLGTDWLLLEGTTRSTRDHELLVPVAGICRVEGLGVRADAGAVPRRLGLRHALRGLSRDRARVRVHDLDGDHLTGTIDAVLADHLDLARHADDEPRREAAVRTRVSLPYSALAMVRRL